MEDKDIKDLKRLKIYGFKLSGAWLSVSLILFFLNRGDTIIAIFFPLSIIVLIQTLFFLATLKYTENFLKSILEGVLLIITKVSTIVLFLLVITPLAMIIKIMKQKTLDLDIDKKKFSYWQKIDADTIENRHKRQF